MSILRFSDMYFRLIFVNIVQEENQPVVNETYQGACAQVPKPNMPNECYDGWISEIFSREQFSGSRIVGDLIEPSQAAVMPVAVESREVPVTCKKNPTKWSFIEYNTVSNQGWLNILYDILRQA